MKSGRLNLSSMCLENRLVGGKYRILKSIGSGSFGEIYRGLNTENGHDVAIKIEASDVKYPLLNYEAKVYNQIGRNAGMPLVYHYCAEKGINALVMEMLGPSLEDLFNLCNRFFSLKTVLMLSDQMLMRIECVHRNSYIHRDVKPDNFLMGLGKKCNRVYMIDFGLAKRYQLAEDRHHIPYREDRNLTGTARYASINAQNGIEQSRRDDLESLSYCIMYFNMGKLPWQGIKASTKQQKYEKIYEMKRSLNIEETCKNCPPEIGLFLKYTRNLRFESEPDYGYLRQIYRVLFGRLNHQYDHIYDWTHLPPQQKNHDRERERNRRDQRTDTDHKCVRHSRNEPTRSRVDREPVGDGTIKKITKQPK